MQRCEIFGTKVSHGNNVSHSKRATKRIWRPNLQAMKLNINGEEVKVRVSTKAMKTLKGKNDDQIKKILLANKESLSPRVAKALFSVK
jgi:ribosomal protein L28